MKKNISIFISMQGYVRNYISSGALRDLSKEYNLSLIISDKVLDLVEIQSAKFQYKIYEEDHNRNQVHYYILDLLMWRYRKKSSTFRFRLKRTQGFRLDFLDNMNFISKAIRIIWRCVRVIYFLIRNLILANALVLPIYSSYLTRKIGKNSKLESIIISQEPDLVLFPCSAHDPVGNDLINICKSLKIPSFFLVDNWDNLSSKSVFVDKPDFIGVWGVQSVEHAINIQNFNKDNILILGTPRYQHYFDTRNIKLTSPYKTKYILFVGTALEFDEPSVLYRIDDILSSNELFKSIKIVYRPHPWRQGLNIVDVKKTKNIIIDDDLKEAYLRNDNSNNLQPTLENYPALIQNSEFVMGGLTSMLIEALIFRKSFLGLTHDDKKNLTSMHNVYKAYEHFRGIENIENVFLCDNLQDLEIQMELTLKKSINAEVIDAQRDYFYSQPVIGYSKKLSSSCDLILNL